MEEEKLESMLDLSSVAIKILAKYVDIECSVDRHEIGEAMKEYATESIKKHCFKMSEGVQEICELTGSEHLGNVLKECIVNEPIKLP